MRGVEGAVFWTEEKRSNLSASESVYLSIYTGKKEGWEEKEAILIFRHRSRLHRRLRLFLHSAQRAC